MIRIAAQAYFVGLGIGAVIGIIIAEVFLK